VIRDFLDYVQSDSVLNTLLGAGNGNLKYFAQAPQEGETTPYFVYGYQSDGSTGEVISDSMLRLQLVVEEAYYDTAMDILLRLDELVDIQDEAKRYIPSFYYGIKYSKRVGGSDAFDDSRRRHELTRLYLVKYLMMTDSGADVYLNAIFSQRPNPGTYAAIVATAPSTRDFRYATDARQLLFYTGNATYGDGGWVSVLVAGDAAPNFYVRAVLNREPSPGLYADIVATTPMQYRLRFATDAGQLLFYTKDQTLGDNGWSVVG